MVNFLVINYRNFNNGMDRYWIWKGQPNSTLSLGNIGPNDIYIPTDYPVRINIGRDEEGYYAEKISSRNHLYKKLEMRENIKFSVGKDQKIRLYVSTTPAFFINEKKYIIEDLNFDYDKKIFEFTREKRLQNATEHKLYLDPLKKMTIDDFLNSDSIPDLLKSIKKFERTHAMPEFEVGEPNDSEYISQDQEKTVEKKNYKIVKIYYGTDRNIESFNDNEVKFGFDRGNHITYGECKVSIPNDHKLGELELPKWWNFNRENPNKHFVLMNTIKLSEAEFFHRNRTATVNSALLFIHGYNVSFTDAAKRTAQIYYDLKFGGTPFFYSWPSKANELSYTIDEESIAWAKENVTVFLKKLLAFDKFENVYLIAHSMGNRALTGALTSIIADSNIPKEKITEIILTAPDIDADIFKRDIAPKIAQVGSPVTLYASSADKALCISKKVHGYKRVGDTEGGILIIPGIESIDATKVNTSFLGHSYYGDEVSVLSDMYYLIKSSTRADDRFQLQKITNLNGDIYWEFKS